MTIFTPIFFQKKTHIFTEYSDLSSMIPKPHSTKCFGPGCTDKGLETAQVMMGKSEGDMLACQTPPAWQVLAVPPGMYRMFASAFFFPQISP